MSPEYIAGYFDGEGSIGIYYYPQHRGVQRQIGVVNSYRPFLAELHAAFGGTFYFLKQGRNKAMYRWSVNSKADIERFLALIEPHLKEKQRQARLALAEVRGELPTMDAVRLLKEAKGRTRASDNHDGDNHDAPSDRHCSDQS